LAKRIRDRIDCIVESVWQLSRSVASEYAECLNNKLRPALRRAYWFKAKEIGTP
jgi:hypothetical protein